MEAMLSECNHLGWTFDYGLDCKPVNLRPVALMDRLYNRFQYLIERRTEFVQERNQSDTNNSYALSQGRVENMNAKIEELREVFDLLGIRRDMELRKEEWVKTIL